MRSMKRWTDPKRLENEVTSGIFIDSFYSSEKFHFPGKTPPSSKTQPDSFITDSQDETDRNAGIT